VQNGKVWEDLTPIYAYLKHEEQAPVARGVFEGTQTSAREACGNNTDCTGTLSAGNGNWWMMCNKQNILCPDAFAPAAPVCEQSEWSKENNRPFEVSDNKVDCENQKFFASSFNECESMVENTNGGQVPFPGGLPTNAGSGVTFLNGECHMTDPIRELFAPDGLWVENRTYDPIGCSLNSDGKVVFRSQSTANNKLVRTDKKINFEFVPIPMTPLNPSIYDNEHFYDPQLGRASFINLSNAPYACKIENFKNYARVIGEKTTTHYPYQVYYDRSGNWVSQDNQPGPCFIYGYKKLEWNTIKMPGNCTSLAKFENGLEAMVKDHRFSFYNKNKCRTWVNGCNKKITGNCYYERNSSSKCNNTRTKAGYYNKKWRKCKWTNGKCVQDDTVDLQCPE